MKISTPPSPGMISGYILAGGKSSRMGGDKGDVELLGSTLIEIAAANLSDLCGADVTVVGRSANRELPHINDHKFVDDLEFGGPLVGIYTAMADSRSEVTIVIPCDMPFLGDAVLGRLLAELDPGAEAVVAVQPDGFIQPLAAVYRTVPTLTAAREILERGIRVPKALLDTLNTRSVRFDGAGFERSFFNINTPADLELARRLASVE